MPQSFVDSHAHLFYEDFANDLEDVLARARDSGVMDIVVPATNVVTSEQSLALAQRTERVAVAVGIHPHEAGKMTDEDLQRIEEFSRAPEVVAIGEIGLDFHYDFAPRDVQRARFRSQIGIAVQEGLPIIVHTRESMEEAVDIVVEAANASPGWCAGGADGRRGVFHCFTGTAEQAKLLFDAGFYVSYPGILTFKNSPVLGTLREIGLDRVLLETDAPYLTPAPFRGKRNEPSYLLYTAHKMAEVVETTVDDVAAVTTRNARTLFALR